MSSASMQNSKANLVPARRSNKPKAPSHPSYMDMIHKCIAEAGDKDGVSRQRLKAFITKRFGLEVEGDKRMSGALTRCIHHGVEIGELVQPKGPAGKIKLSPKAKARDRKKDKAADESKSEGAKKSSKDERKPKKKATSSSTRIVSSDEDDDDNDASSDGNESDVSSDGDEQSPLPVKGKAKAKVISASKVKPSAKARKVKTSKKASNSSSSKKAPKKASGSSSSSRKR